MSGSGRGIHNSGRTSSSARMSLGSSTSPSNTIPENFAVDADDESGVPNTPQDIPGPSSVNGPNTGIEVYVLGHK
jgi:hypothetical protein